MSARKKNAIGVCGLVILAAATSFITNAIISKRSTAKATPHVVQPARQDDLADIIEAQEAAREASRKPYSTYHDILRIVPVGNDDRIAFFADVECWHGEDFFPTMPEFMRGIRLRVTVYGPNDPQCSAAPVAYWESPAVEAVEGLYQERVPVEIAARPNAEPYHVTVELVSAGSVNHKPLRAEASADVPKGFAGERIMFTVQ